MTINFYFIAHFIICDKEPILLQTSHTSGLANALFIMHVNHCKKSVPNDSMTDTEVVGLNKARINEGRLYCILTERNKKKEEAIFDK